MLSLLRVRPLFFSGSPTKTAAALLDLPITLPRAPPPPLAARILRRGLSSTTAQMEGRDVFAFGPYKIHKSEVFFSSPLSYAMVNLRPLLPGHVLVCPRREVKRFIDLTADETIDLWLTAKEVGGKLERYHEASSLTFAIQSLLKCYLITGKKKVLASTMLWHILVCKLTYVISSTTDGPQAGQTVPHVHIHIIPRKKGDFEKNDEIYDAIDVKEKELKDKLDLDIERKDRSFEEMAREADAYRVLFT